MNDFTTSDRDVSRAIRSWLHEDRHEDASRVAGAVLDRVEAAPRRRAAWPARRTPIMNKIVAIGLGAAAVVALLIVGAQLIDSPNTGVGGPTRSAAPTEAPASVAPPSAGNDTLPVGPHVMGGRWHGEDRVTVTIPAPGWSAPDEGSLTKDLGGGNRVTVVVVPGDYYQMPRNICDWQIEDADLRAARMPQTVDEFVAYLTEQTYDTPDGSLTRDVSAPVDITIDGSHGQRIMVAVPEFPGGDPNACDEQRFCTLQDRDSWGCLLSHEPGAGDTLWIVDPPVGRNYLLVVASSGSPNTELRTEVDAIVESITFFTE